MRTLKRIYHFLGGIRFAILLIALAAGTVVAGTLLESKTDSHLLAAQWTYGHPLFQLLLGLFFINILFSALRRWPFKKKHIPFLMTHLGLLMILSGTILKNRYGLQGNLSVWEGSSNHLLLVPHSHAIYIEKKGENSDPPLQSIVALNSFHRSVYTPPHFPELKCKLVGYAPHVEERLETWIKGDTAVAAGLPPLKMHEWKPNDPLPEFTYTPLSRGSPQFWDLIALRTTSIEPLIAKLYTHDLILHLKSKENKALSFSSPLQKAIENPFTFARLNWQASLNLSSHTIHSASLQLIGTTAEGFVQEQLTIALQGQQALYVQSDPMRWSELACTVDLKRKSPLLCFSEDDAGNVVLVAFDEHGRLHVEPFSQSEQQTLLAYDQGYGGYATQAALPFPTFPASRQDKEEADAYELSTQLKQAMAGSPTLAPPLHLLKEACASAQEDFCTTFVQLLMEWSSSQGIFYHPILLPASLEKVLNRLDWEGVNETDLKAVQWTRKLMFQLEQALQQGEDPIAVLKRNRWPFVNELQQNLEQTEPISPSTHFARQVFSISAYLPPLSPLTPITTQEHAQLLTAYLKGYGIDPRSLLSMRENGPEQFDRLEAYWREHPSQKIENFEKETTLETPLTRSIHPKEAPLRLEDHRPGIILEMEKGGEKQRLALAYDAAGTGLKWPILSGEYVVRFQPLLKELPYRIRLRQARQISYPNSPQVYSYESDLLITESGKDPIAETVSMNRVYETWDGYRFYLSSVGTSGDQGLKRVQLVINHDPAKYFLTYPGALLVFFGALSLFWGRSFRRNS